MEALKYKAKMSEIGQKQFKDNSGKVDNVRNSI